MIVSFQYYAPSNTTQNERDAISVVENEVMKEPENGKF